MPTRRELLGQALTAAAAVAALPAEAQKLDVPLIDTHQHLWDFRESFRPPWLKDAPPLNKSHSLQDYWREAAGTGIVKTVYMEVDLDPKDQVREAEYVSALCRRPETKMVGAVVSCRPAEPGFEAYARRVAAMPAIKGLRQIVHVDSTPKGYCLQPEFVKNMQLLGKLGMTYDICIRPGELADAAKLAEQCPGTIFILDHCGNLDINAADWSDWQRGMETVAKQGNVICKVSGIIRNVKPGTDKGKKLEPAIRHVINTFGWDRVIWASDWPVCTFGASLREWVAAARYAVRNDSEENQRKLFFDNAARFYGV